jgi:hypothetical protein
VITVRDVLRTDEFQDIVAACLLHATRNGLSIEEARANARDQIENAREQAENARAAWAQRRGRLRSAARVP